VRPRDAVETNRRLERVDRVARVRDATIETRGETRRKEITRASASSVGSGARARTSEHETVRKVHHHRLECGQRTNGTATASEARRDGAGDDDGFAA